jgi:hypothetical protein
VLRSFGLGFCLALQLSLHLYTRSIVTAEYRFVAKMQRASAPQAISPVYTEAAGFCSTEILIAAGNPGGRLKPRRELARALGNSATLAQNVAQAAGQLLTCPPQPRL